MDATAPIPAPAPDPEEFSNRKLIRPSLARPDRGGDSGPRGDRPPRFVGKKPAPASEQTHAENFYYQKQIQSKTQLTIVLKDGEELTGWIEWYDRNCIKLNRSGQSHVLIYKMNIKYMYKTSESSRIPR